MIMNKWEVAIEKFLESSDNQKEENEEKEKNK